MTKTIKHVLVRPTPDVKNNARIRNFLKVFIYYLAV